MKTVAPGYIYDRSTFYLQYKSSVLAHFQWTLDISLQDDYRVKIFKYLRSCGYKDVNERDAVFQYFNLQKRQLEARPRRVLYSKEFICPDRYEQALKEFEEKCIEGKSLHPYMSSKLRFANYNDLLLNDWNIQHFHLTRRFNKDGSAKSSDYEIFAYVTDDAIYMIQVYNHQAEDLYSNQNMIRIIHDNWPKLIEKNHLKGVTGLEEKIDNHTYGLFRKGGVSTFVELGENEVYGLIGGGYASNGFSNEAVRNADFWLNRLRTFQTIIKDNAVWIGKTIDHKIGMKAELCQMIIKLLWIKNADKATMYERNSGLIVQIDTGKRRLRICKGHKVFVELF